MSHRVASDRPCGDSRAISINGTPHFSCFASQIIFLSPHSVDNLPFLTIVKMPISSQASDTIKSSLDGCTSSPDSGIPGLVFVSVDKNGKTLAAHASGKRAPTSDDPMTLDTVFWIASCTKMITGLACMQLVEQGKISLDDHQQVYKLCPELEKIKVLQDGKLVDRKGDITLRKLLSHTAGFGYEFFNKGLMDYGRAGGAGVKAAGYEVFSGDERDITRQPLVNQPGTAWEYGVSIIEAPLK
jgi:hypothetical protein